MALPSGQRPEELTFRVGNENIDERASSRGMIRKNANDEGMGRRPDEIRLYKEVGYKEWAKIKEYGLRWPSTEGIISAVKRMFDECVKSHKKRSMYHEAKLKFWAYQKLRDLV